MLVPFAEAYVNWLDNPEKAQGWVDRLSKRELNITNSGLCAAYGGYMAYRNSQGACEPWRLRELDDTLCELYRYSGWPWPFTAPKEIWYERWKCNAHLNPVRQQFVRRLAQLTETITDDYGNTVFKSTHAICEDFRSGFDFYGEKLLRRSYA